IARAPATRDRIDREGGKSVRLVVRLEDDDQQIVRRLVPAAVDASGFSGYEWLGDSKHPRAQWRWALLPSSELSFDIGEPRRLRVAARFKTPLAGQKVDVELDGRVVETWKDLPIDAFVERSIEAPVGPGRHVLRLRYARGNAKPPRGVVFAP